jgi:hypothetical protein
MEAILQASALNQEGVLSEQALVRPPLGVSKCHHQEASLGKSAGFQIAGGEY